MNFIYLKYIGKENSRVNTGLGGEKQNIKNGDIIKFEAKKGKEILRIHPKNFRYIEQEKNTTNNYYITQGKDSIIQTGDNNNISKDTNNKSTFLDKIKDQFTQHLVKIIFFLIISILFFLYNFLVKESRISIHTPIETVSEYFSALNTNKFKKACSFLPLSKCNPEDSEELKSFSSERMKFINGYENIEIWETESNNISNSKIICVKYSYQLKADLNPSPIWEVFSFYLDKKEAVEEWSITSRVCEKIFKDNRGERACPIPTSQKFCI